MVKVKDEPPMAEPNSAPNHRTSSASTNNPPSTYYPRKPRPHSHHHHHPPFQHYTHFHPCSYSPENAEASNGATSPAKFYFGPGFEPQQQMPGGGFPGPSQTQGNEYIVLFHVNPGVTINLQLGENLEVLTGNETKTLWLKLRNCHRDALQRQKKCLKSGAAAVVIKIWKFQKQMNFLIPCMSNRSHEGNLQEDSEDEDPQQEDSIVDPDSEIVDEVTSDIRHDIEEIESVKNDIVNEPSTSGIVIQKNNEKENAKRKATEDQSITTKPAKNKKPKNDDIQEVIKQSIIQHQKRTEERAVERANDDLYHFYMSMYKITKKNAS
uniref:Uncharacterized protein LOC114338097 n=1 Tax=Diabrotica virgifera virgifera TaxID=50390 RepID=A0A6P7GH73_DIAVI